MAQCSSMGEALPLELCLYSEQNCNLPPMSLPEVYHCDLTIRIPGVRHLLSSEFWSCDVSWAPTMSSTTSSSRGHSANKMIRYATSSNCIGRDESTSFCGKIPAPLPEIFKKLSTPESNVHDHAFGYLLLGETFHWGGFSPFEAVLGQTVFAGRWQPMIEELVMKGLVKPHPPLALESRLEAVPQGVEDVGWRSLEGSRPYTRFRRPRDVKVEGSRQG